jgi:hypothetical protein
MALYMRVEEFWGFVKVFVIVVVVVVSYMFLGSKGTSISGFVLLRSFQRHRK